MYHVWSKLKNPDKYIEKLKKKISYQRELILSYQRRTPKSFIHFDNDITNTTDRIFIFKEDAKDLFIKNIDQFLPGQLLVLSAKVDSVQIFPEEIKLKYIFKNVSLLKKDKE